MRKLLLIILTLIIFKSFSCSPLPYSGFCYSFELYETVIKGKIIETNPELTKIEILKLYRGNENRDTILIRGIDSTYAVDSLKPCADFDSIYLGTDVFGNINDTIILALNYGNSNHYYWETSADYSIPKSAYHTDYKLNINNDTVKGSIKWLEADSDFAGYSLRKMFLPDFDTLWSNGEMNCDQLLSKNEKLSTQEIIATPNPFKDIITVDINQDVEIFIYNSLGKEMKFEKSYQNNKMQIATPELEKGIYFLNIISSKNRDLVFSKKILKE